MNIRQLGTGVQHARAAAAQSGLLRERGVVAEKARVLPQLGAVAAYRSVYVSEGWIYADAIRPGMGDVHVKEGGRMPLAGVEELRRGLDFVKRVWRGMWSVEGYRRLE